MDDEDGLVKKPADDTDVVWETTVMPKNHLSNTPAPDIVDDGSLRFLLFPLITLAIIFLLAILVYFMLKRNRRRPHIYCKRRLAARSKHNDDSVSNATDEDIDGLNDDVNDPSEALLKGQLQINSPRYLTYQATQTSLSKWSADVHGESFT